MLKYSSRVPLENHGNWRDMAEKDSNVTPSFVFVKQQSHCSVLPKRAPGV